ncbi:hypothetical protein MMC13_005087 [Lambiella insularis]|nr:hypothetical protein [Lambiella insularis]
MPSPTFSPTAWSLAAPQYNTRVGSMDRAAGARLISLLTTLSPILPSSRAMDLGCGTGTITHALTALHPALPIAAVDIAPGMLAELAAHATTTAPHISTHELDAAALGAAFAAGAFAATLAPEAAFSHILSTFMLQYSPAPAAVLRGARAALREGGVLGVGLWGRGNGPLLLWEAACRAADPGYRVPEPHEGGAWTTGAELEGGLRGAGFPEVGSERVEVDFGVRSTEEMVGFWFEGGNPVAGRLVADWVRVKGGVQEVRGVYERVCREEWGDGRGLRVEVVLGWGRK